MHLGNELYKQLSIFLRFFEVIASIYALLRNATTRRFVSKNKLPDVIAFLVLSILALLITMIIYASILPLICYKILITSILAVKYKENFEGVLKGADVIWTADKDHLVTYALIIQFDKFNNTNLLDYARELCVKKFFRAARLTCILQSFMGYHFLIKNQLSVDDVVRELPPMKGPPTLRKIVQDHCNKPLPKNNTAAWELLVGTQPIDSDDQYPLLIRMHHSIADGMTFLSLLVKQISDEKTSIINVPKYEGRGDAVKIWVGVKKLFHLTFSGFLVKKIFDDVSKGIRNFAGLHTHMIVYHNYADAKELNNRNMSGRKRIGFYVERDRKYLSIIRSIKNKIEGASFSSVIFTAMSASLEEYFKKKEQPPPESLILGTMAISDRKNLNFDHPELANLFTLGNMKLLVAFDENKTLFERLLAVDRTYAEFTQSHDIWINESALRVVVEVLPAPMIWVMKQMYFVMKMISTISFSALPGFSKIHFGGHALKHLLFWVPNYLSIGIGFSLVTYDDRLQMGLMVDEVIIPEEDDVQGILDDVFKYIDLMNENQ